MGDSLEDVSLCSNSVNIPGKFSSVSVWIHVFSLTTVPFSFTEVSYEFRLGLSRDWEPMGTLLTCTISISNPKLPLRKRVFFLIETAKKDRTVSYHYFCRIFPTSIVVFFLLNPFHGYQNLPPSIPGTTLGPRTTESQLTSRPLWRDQRNHKSTEQTEQCLIQNLKEWIILI